ncbi:hypothetical protein [Arthrobacter sp. fls2-241-R2A-172]|uniref:hypothetical protein n=1 Tax=Arthrobacter sp. fls2-241-R2A-172 TaxID=3040325 RepID=UPI00254BA7E9|nr:hypothetical protein [Arthrobacter sp. fls2-241-R2A-172]
MASSTTISTQRNGSFAILIGFVVIAIQSFLTGSFVLWPLVVGSLLVFMGCCLRIESAILQSRTEAPAADAQQAREPRTSSSSEVPVME